MSDLSALPRRSVQSAVSRRGGQLAAAAATGAGVVLLARLVRRVAVQGESMAPALAPDDRLVLVPPLWLCIGQVVALHDPRGGRRLLLKRIAQVDRRAGLVTVLGDNPDASTDSRQFGPVPIRSVVGRAVYRYAPAGRAGLVL